MNSVPVSSSSNQTNLDSLYFNPKGTIQWKGHTYKVSVGNVDVTTKEGLEKIQQLLENALGKIQPTDTFERATITANHIVTKKTGEDDKTYSFNETEKKVYETAIKSFQEMQGGSSVGQASKSERTAGAPIIEISQVHETLDLMSLKEKVKNASEGISQVLTDHNKARVDLAKKSSTLEELKKGDKKLQEEANQKLEQAYKDYESALCELTAAYNKASDSDKPQYEAAIKEMNSYRLKASFSTSAESVYHYGCSLYVASQFKALELNEQLNLETDPKKRSAIEKERNELIGMKPPEELKGGKLFSVKEAKKRYNGYNDTYAFQQKGLKNKNNYFYKLDIKSFNRALCLPGNWLNKKEIAVGLLGDNAYVNVTSVTPIEIGGEYSPSGQRKANEEHPPNFQKTEAYLLDDSGNIIESSRSQSYRCGVFGSQKSADKAIEEMVKENKPIYDDSLLTPSEAPKFLHEDRGILEKHVGFAAQAAQNKNVELRQSNFGINVGAVKGFMIKGFFIGWHSAIKKYNNKFVSELNHSLKTWFQGAENDVKKVKQAAAVYQLTLEMEAIWAKNDFARADVDGNPAKLPGISRVLMEKLGYTVNQHCKSCKDRGSVAEGYATRVHHEIEMKRQNYRKFLEGLNVTPALSQDQQEMLTSGLFSEDEISAIVSDADVNKKIETEVKSKMDAIRAHLHLDQAGPFKEKTISSGLSSRLPGLKGIEETTPLRNTGSNVVQGAGLMEPSIYQLKPDLKQLNTIAVNRRNAITMGLLVTKENTAVSGVKQKQGMIATLYCGFNRQYAKEIWQDCFDKNNYEALYEVLGLSELDQGTQKDLKEIILKANKKSIDAVLIEVELAKEAVLNPLAKVSS